MSKMIAIIDEPGDCFDCPLLNRDYCINNKCTLSKRWMNSIDLTKRPDWCELKPVPEREHDADPCDNYYRGVEDGWNNCIDEISGE